MDLRIQKTYRSLVETFEELLSRKSYDEISVAAICDAAMIRRPTFYKHFKDKDDFFAYFVSQLKDQFMLEQASEAVARGAEPLEQIEQVIGRIADFLLAHRWLMDNAVKGSTSGTVSKMVSSLLAELLCEEWAEWYQANDGENPELALEDVSAFAAGGFVSLAVRWWGSEDREATRDAFVTSSSALVYRAMEG